MLTIETLRLVDEARKRVDDAYNAVGNLRDLEQKTTAYESERMNKLRHVMDRLGNCSQEIERIYS